MLQSVGTVSKNKRERKAILDIEEKLSELECYEPICVDEYFPMNQAQKYTFVKRVLGNGLIIKCALFSHSYKGSLGNTYFMWHEDMTYENNRTGVIEEIKRSLPKFFSRAHKKKMKELTNLIMLDKILPAQFRMLYRELTGNCSVSDNSQSKQCDERWQTIIKHAKASMLRDLQVNNGRTPKYDKFWDLVNWQHEEMQAVDD